MQHLENMIRVACIEDDPYFSKMAEEVLRMQPEVVCLLAAPSVEAFWEKFPVRGGLDILFVDVELPGQSGVAAIPALKRRFPGTEIIMLTHVEDEEVLLRALHLGAGGYLNKDFPLFQLPQFIQTVRRGGALISPKMARKLVQYFNPPAPVVSSAEILNTKEAQVLRLFSEGSSYEEAASVMGITADGVRYHVRNIYRKLNVNNKVDAIRAFKTLGDNPASGE